MIRAALISLPLLAACAPESEAQGPAYRGIATQILQADLVRVVARVERAATPDPVTDYARCGAARYAMQGGFGFARHLRTNIDEKGGVWTADAVYTISPTLPRGLETIDAEVTVAACAENGIPTV